MRAVPFLIVWKGRNSDSGESWNHLWDIQHHSAAILQVSVFRGWCEKQLWIVLPMDKSLIVGTSVSWHLVANNAWIFSHESKSLVIDIFVTLVYLSGLTFSFCAQYSVVPWPYGAGVFSGKL